MRSKTLIFVLILIGVGGTTLDVANAQANTGESRPLPHTSEPFRVPVKVRSCTLRKTLPLPGTIRSTEFFESRSNYGAVISEIHVSIGEKVKKGQLLATTNEQYLVKNIEWTQRQVGFGKMQLEKALADVKFYKDKSERLEILVKKQLISAAELENVEKELRSALDAEKTARSYLADSEKSLREATVRRNQANFYAEGDGVITQIIADRKAMTGHLLTDFNSVIARIDKPGQYTIEAMALDTQAQRIRVGMPAKVIFADRTTLAGKVSSVSSSPIAPKNQDGFGNQTPGWGEPSNEGQQPFYRIQITLKKDGALLPQEMSVVAEVDLQQISVPKCLPWNAVKLVDGKPFIAVFINEKGWTFQPIKIGRSDSLYVELIDYKNDQAQISAALW